MNYKTFQSFENISLTEGMDDEIAVSYGHLQSAVARYAEKHENLMEQRENIAKAQADPMPMLERSIGQMDLRYIMQTSAEVVATDDAASDATDDTETDVTETESPMTLNTMSLADILADEGLLKLLGIDNPIIISNTANETTETTQTTTDNTVAA